MLNFERLEKRARTNLTGTICNIPTRQDDPSAPSSSVHIFPPAAIRPNSMNDVFACFDVVGGCYYGTADGIASGELLVKSRRELFFSRLLNRFVDANVTTVSRLCCNED